MSHIYITYSPSLVSNRNYDFTVSVDTLESYYSTISEIGRYKLQEEAEFAACSYAEKHTETEYTIIRMFYQVPLVFVYELWEVDITTKQPIKQLSAACSKSIVEKLQTSFQTESIILEKTYGVTKEDYFKIELMTNSLNAIPFTYRILEQLCK